MRAAGWTLWLAFVQVGCAPEAPPPAAADTTHGPDLALVEGCLGCHADLAERWSGPSSHSLLLDCGTCHEQRLERPGPGHRAKPDCASCHSAETHRTFGCTGCHEPHGSSNLFLVRPELPVGAPVRLTRAEGASADGLARAGVAGQSAGTGTCEVCHLSTRYYPSSGTGLAHDRAWCVGCHSHETGFRPPP